MRLSTRARYGLRAMLEIAMSNGESPVMMRSISENQGISRKYLHAILTTLKSAGLVRSVRGVRGGYTLSRSPSRIQVSEVIRVLEGSLSVVDCVQENGLCARSETCVTRDVWLDVNRAIEGVLGNLTLEDLVQRQKRKEVRAPMYII